MATSVRTPLKLPNGVVLRNRVIKAAMSEYLADTRDNRCNEALCELYRSWAGTHAAVLITGNVMVTREHMEAPTNVAVELSDLGDPMLERCSRACAPCLLVAQISHCGRQCPISVSYQPVAPSAVPLDLFPTAFVNPRALETHEVERIVTQFADTAFVLHRAGFAGVQVHAAHGYLLSSFLSPLLNRREDRYGGSLENRMRVLLQIIAAVRARVNDGSFIVSVKLNSSDFQKGGFAEDDALQVCRALEHAGVDFLELSGGNYETAGDSFMQSASRRAREGYFCDFAARAKRAVSTMPIMVTGGFRTLTAMNEALASGALDLVGMARPFAFDTVEALHATVAERSLGRPLAAPETNVVDERGALRALNGGIAAVWYARQLERIASGLAPSEALSRWWCLVLVVPKYYYHPGKSRLPLRWIGLVLALLWLAYALQ